MIKYDEIDDMTKNSINTILERNGIVWSLEDEKLITINDLAIQLNMAIDTLKKHITRRLNKLEEGSLTIKGKLYYEYEDIIQRLINTHRATKKIRQVKLIDPIGILHICNTTSGFKQLQIIENLFYELPDVYLEINSESNMAFLKRYQTELSVLIDTIFHNHNVEHEKYVEGYRIDFLIDNHIAIECDETGHDYYDVKHEKSREAVMGKYGYVFYRYDVRDNNMLLFIGDLLDSLLLSQTEKT